MKKNTSLSKTGMYLFLIIVAFVSVFPFYYMISASANRSIEVIGGRMYPGLYLFQNVKQILSLTNPITAFWNSLRNAVVLTLASLFICSMAGYGFVIYRDKAKDRLMTILLLSMMVPFASVMIPLFRMFSQMKLLDTTIGFILPSISTAFLIFFFRQCTMTFPLEVVQAARVDGLGEFGIYARVYVPIMSPTIAAAAIVTFMNGWNNYLWPLIIMKSQGSRTMPLLITGLTAGYTTDYGILMLAVTVCTIPTLVLFFTQQKRFVAGILGSVK
ncbi:lactose ABC transporter permease [Spirochaetia bacterium]|nr:lactose ABC transporter permease [Spirochaetia bacterium]